MYETG
jgi:hypothetical protein